MIAFDSHPAYLHGALLLVLLRLHTLLHTCTVFLCFACSSGLPHTRTSSTAAASAPAPAAAAAATTSDGGATVEERKAPPVPQGVVPMASWYPLLALVGAVCGVVVVVEEGFPSPLVCPQAARGAAPAVDAPAATVAPGAVPRAAESAGSTAAAP